MRQTAKMIESVTSTAIARATILPGGKETDLENENNQEEKRHARQDETKKETKKETK